MHIDLPARRPTQPLGEMHVFEDGTYVGLNPIAPESVNFSIVCDPEALRGRAVVELINSRIARSPYLRELMEPLAATAKPGATFPINARVRSAAVHDAALVGDASGYIDPLTGEGIYGAMWTADELVRQAIAGWNDLPAALQNYARARARRQQAKSALCEVFQQIIVRPHLANGVHWLLSRKQAVADSFIGVIGNSYSPAHGFLRIAKHAFVN
jgi:2-polyprenyl-6-methoxyphenol hydroxylase-like FAD-dependent oxidoreductase